MAPSAAARYHSPDDGRGAASGAASPSAATLCTMKMIALMSVRKSMGLVEPALQAYARLLRVGMLVRVSAIGLA